MSCPTNASVAIFEHQSPIRVGETVKFRNGGVVPYRVVRRDSQGPAIWLTQQCGENGEELDEAFEADARDVFRVQRNGRWFGSVPSA